MARRWTQLLTRSDPRWGGTAHIALGGRALCGDPKGLSPLRVVMQDEPRKSICSDCRYAALDIQRRVDEERAHWAAVRAQRAKETA